ncbi:MAG: hypothetical protein ACFFD4_38875 [Candidatus Odinarchaeota archaeon]
MPICEKKLLMVALVLLWTSVLMVIEPSAACTIFTITDGEVVFFGNNEDNFQSRHGRIWFYPAADGKFGRILFGFRIHDAFDVPVGGVNDQGLCVDMNAIPVPPLAVHSDKEYYVGSFMKILDECSTVAEVKEWVKSRDMTFLQSDQAHFADKSGDAAVMGLDSNGETYFTNKTGDYLISTNFNRAQDFYHGQCWRYGKAAEMLGNVDIVTVDNSRAVLNATALPVIMYSYILDLTNGLIYLYSFGDFERVAVLDIHEELARGIHSYDIETLVSQQTGTVKTPAFTSFVISVFIFLATAVLSALLYVFKIRPDLAGKEIPRKFQSVKTVSEIKTNNENLRTKLDGFPPVFRFLLFITVFSVLIIIAKITTYPLYLDMVEIPVTVTIHVSFTFILICITGIAFRPSIAFIISSTGLLAGEIIFWLLHGSSIIELPVYMILSLSSLGVATLAISAVRKKNTVLAMISGCILAFTGWYLVSSVYYNTIIHLGTEPLLLCLMLITAVNVILLPVAMVLNKGLETAFRVKYLDELIFLQTASEKNAFPKQSVKSI